MKCLMRSIFVFSLLWCGSSLASVNPQWNGHFQILELGEKLIDGSQVILQYDININNNKEIASLDMNTWHAPITCIGDYTMKNNKGVLVLYYSTQSENPECHFPSPQFELKKSRGKFYIRGRIFTYSSPGEWLLLKKMDH